MEKEFEFVSNHQERRLANGLTIIAGQRPQAQWQELLICVRAGAKDDPLGLEGMAHLLEHQIMREADLSAPEFESYFEDLGGNAKSGATGMLSTYWRFMLPREAFAQGVDLCSRFLFCPKWDHSTIFSQEKEAVLREFAERKKSLLPEELLRLSQVLFPNKVLGRHLFGPVGTLEGIKAIGLAEIADFHSKYYQPSNLVLLAEGGFSADELVEILQKSHFGAGQQPSWQNPLLDFETARFAPKFRRVEYRVSDWAYPESGQTEVCLRGLVPGKRSPVNQVLREAIMAQAFRMLRTERNLVYSTQQSFVSSFPLTNNQFKFVAILDQSVDVEVVPQVWHDFLKWLETEEFDSFVRKKRDNFLSKSRFPDYYRWDQPSLLDLADDYMEKVSFPALSREATIARWEALKADDAREYIPYMKEYVMLIGHI